MKKHFRIGLLLSLSLLVCAACLCITANAITLTSHTYAKYVGTAENPAKVTVSVKTSRLAPSGQSSEVYFSVYGPSGGDFQTAYEPYKKKGAKVSKTFALGPTYALNPTTGKNVLSSWLISANEYARYYDNIQGKEIDVPIKIGVDKKTGYPKYAQGVSTFFKVITPTAFKNAKADVEFVNSYKGSVTLKFNTKATHYVYKKTKSSAKYKLYKKVTGSSLKVEKLSKTKKTYFKVVDKVTVGGKTYESKANSRSLIAGSFKLKVYYGTGKINKKAAVALYMGKDKYGIQSRSISKLVIKRATSKNGTYKTIKTVKIKKFDRDMDLLNQLVFVNQNLSNNKTYYFKITPYLGKTKCSTVTVKVPVKVTSKGGKSTLPKWWWNVSF